MMDQRKILVVGMTDNPGGIETLLLNVMASARDDGYKFDFIANVPELAFENEIKSLGSEVFHICSRHNNRFRFYSDLKVIFQEHASQYYAVWENANSLANIDYLIYAKRYGIPIRIVHAHNSRNSEGMIRGTLHGVNRMRVKNIATHFWSVSDEASEWFFGKSYKSLPNYKVITNAIDTKRFAFSDDIRFSLRDQLNIPMSAVVFGNVGRLHAQKNQSFAIDIFAAYNRINPDSRFLILGKGELEEELKKQAVHLGIDDKVVFMGAVDNSKPFYDIMDLFLFPSQFEGLPIALLEAQANGLPCLISDSISSSANVNNNIIGLSLHEPIDRWVDRCCDLVECGRNAYPEICESKYDISNLSGIFSEL